MDTIKALIIEPDKKPYTKEITNELKTFQGVVGGPIETLSLVNAAIIVCNENGKILGLPPNRPVCYKHLVLGSDACFPDKVADIICGTFFVVGSDDVGELCSITEEQAKDWTKEFSKFIK